MAYRRTENVVRRLNARHDAIVEAVGTRRRRRMAAAQIVPVAEPAGTRPAPAIATPRQIDPLGARLETLAER